MFCPNKQRSFEPIICLDFVCVCLFVCLFCFLPRLLNSVAAQLNNILHVVAMTSHCSFYVIFLCFDFSLFCLLLLLLHLLDFFAAQLNNILHVVDDLTLLSFTLCFVCFVSIFVFCFCFVYCCCVCSISPPRI